MHGYGRSVGRLVSCWKVAKTQSIDCNVGDAQVKFDLEENDTASEEPHFGPNDVTRLHCPV